MNSSTCLQSRHHEQESSSIQVIKPDFLIGYVIALKVYE